MLLQFLLVLDQLNLAAMRGFLSLIWPLRKVSVAVLTLRYLISTEPQLKLFGPHLPDGSSQQFPGDESLSASQAICTMQNHGFAKNKEFPSSVLGQN